MDKEMTTHDIINKQNDFILSIFNDDDVPNWIKGKYAEKYNELQVKLVSLDY